MAEWPSLKKLAKIRREIDQRRRGIHNTNTRHLQSIARKLGRKLEGGRGAEPTWVSTLLPKQLFPISIPHDVKADGTKFQILTDLEGDVDLLEVSIHEETKDE